MWIYRVAYDIDNLNKYASDGYEFICTRRHPKGHDEYLVRRFEASQTDLEIPFGEVGIYPMRREWVVPAPGQARWYQPTERENKI